MTADTVEGLSFLKESTTSPSQYKQPNVQKYNTFDRIYYRKMTWNLSRTSVNLYGTLNASRYSPS